MAVTTRVNQMNQPIEAAIAALAAAVEVAVVTVEAALAVAAGGGVTTDSVALL